jgi:hypothetical protein
MAIYRDLSSHVFWAWRHASSPGKLTKIDHLNVTPDLLAAVLGEFGRSARLPSGESREGVGEGPAVDHAPRAVFVTRETDYELLPQRHATASRSRSLKTRGGT